MRNFFIFKLKPEFKSLYKDKPSILYNIFEQIYLLKKDDIAYGYSLFRQLTMKIDKENVDKYLFLTYHQSIPYSKKENIHYYNNPAHEEISTLEVKRAYMKVSTNYYDSFFLNEFNTADNQYFVCDFNNQDYFFLDSKKLLV